MVGAEQEGEEDGVVAVPTVVVQHRGGALARCDTQGKTRRTQGMSMKVQNENEKRRGVLKH
jgi:hypothetical protein